MLDNFCASSQDYVDSGGSEHRFLILLRYLGVVVHSAAIYCLIMGKKAKLHPITFLYKFLRDCGTVLPLPQSRNGGTRTRTGWILSPLSLPIGLHSQSTHGRTRTFNLQIRSLLLYPLSYMSISRLGGTRTPDQEIMSFLL